MSRYGGGGGGGRFRDRRSPPDISGLTSLKVDNLTYRTTVDDLRRAFARYGEVGDIYIPRDRSRRESRGFAFVRFIDKRDAEDAMDRMDGKIFDGRELRVQMAKHERPGGTRGRRSESGRRRSYSRSPSRKSRSRSRSPVQHSPDRNRSRSRSGSN